MRPAALTPRPQSSPSCRSTCVTLKQVSHLNLGEVLGESSDLHEAAMSVFALRVPGPSVAARFSPWDVAGNARYFGGVAIVKRFGTPAERFPTKPELTDVLVAALYDNHGLSITQIELLTGHTATAIRHTTQTAGLALRSGGRSPWTLEHLNGS